MNLLDYLDWRGDIPFANVEPNEIDALIFAWLSYYRFEDLGEDFGSLTLSELDALHARKFGPVEKVNLNTTIAPDLTAIWLLHRAAQTERFGQVRAADFRQVADAAKGVQFAAISFLVGEKLRVVAYRGTDNTIAGWKEDCYLSLSEAVPAQKLAAQYLEGTRDGREALVCGHSKGGNLAMYAALFASEARLREVGKIYNFDGPGFSFKLEAHDRYAQVKARLRTIVPASSVVGMLLNHEADYQVVESQMVSLLQHDAMFWQVLGGRFVYADARNPSSVFIDRTLREWIDGMSFDERKQFVDAIFSILERTGATELHELPEKIAQNGLRTLTQSTLDPRQKRMVFRLLMNLVRAGSANLYESAMGSEDAKALSQPAGEERTLKQAIGKAAKKALSQPSSDVSAERSGGAMLTAAVDRALDALSTRLAAGKSPAKETDQTQHQ